VFLDFDKLFFLLTLQHFSDDLRNMGLDLNWQVVLHKILEGRDLGGFGVELALKH